MGYDTVVINKNFSLNMTEKADQKMKTRRKIQQKKSISKKE